MFDELARACLCPEWLDASPPRRAASIDAVDQVKLGTDRLMALHSPVPLLHLNVIPVELLVTVRLEIHERWAMAQ